MKDELSGYREGAVWRFLSGCWSGPCIDASPAQVSGEVVRLHLVRASQQGLCAGITHRASETSRAWAYARPNQLIRTSGDRTLNLESEPR